MHSTLNNRWWAVVGFLFATLLALSLMGCAAPPETEMQAARTALDEAKAADAPTYAEEDWSHAQSALAAAEAEIDVQRQKFALFRSYDQAVSLVATAQEEAEEAKSAAVTGKEQARTEAQAAYDEAQTTVEMARSLITEIETCGRPVKGLAADLATLRGGTDALSGELTTISTALSGGRYSEAEDLGQSLEEEAGKMVSDLQSAITTLGCQPTA